MSTAQMEAALNAADSEWDWPDQKPSGSGYYNSAFGGVPPPPKKLAAVPLDEDEDPSKRVTMVRNYSWSDDTDFIRVYVPVPGVVKTGVWGRMHHRRGQCGFHAPTTDQLQTRAFI